MKIKIAVVDDDCSNVDDLCKAVKLAGFEAVPVFVDYDISLDKVVGKAVGSHMVLLDHMMHEFSGQDVAKRLPKEIVVVTTSDHAATDKYCKNRLSGKDRHPFPLQRIAESITMLVGTLVSGLKK